MHPSSAFSALVESVRPHVVEVSIEAYQADDTWVLSVKIMNGCRIICRRRNT